MQTAVNAVIFAAAAATALANYPDVTTVTTIPGMTVAPIVPVPGAELLYPVRTVTIPASDYFPTHLERHAPVTTVNCPVGYAQLLDKCVKTIHRQPDVVCPPGFSFNRDGDIGHLAPDGTAWGKCVKLIAKESECPPAFVRTDYGTCKRRVESAPLRICPEGFAQTIDGLRCKRIVDLAPLRVCPVGTRENTNGDCVQIVREVVELGCDEGVLDGSKCRVEVTYDCTEQFLRAIRTDYKPAYGSFNNRYVRRREIPEVVAKTCRKVTYSEPRRSCPLGFATVGDECVREVINEKIWGLPGVEEQVCDFIVTCPSGYEKFENAGFYRCFGVEEAPVHYHCPNGGFDNGDVCLYFADQEYSCPDEFVLDLPSPNRPDDEASLPICSKAVVAPLQHIVEYGYTCTGTDCPLDPLEPRPSGPSVVPL